MIFNKLRIYLIGLKNKTKVKQINNHKDIEIYYSLPSLNNQLSNKLLHKHQSKLKRNKESNKN